MSSSFHDSLFTYSRSSNQLLDLLLLAKLTNVRIIEWTQFNYDIKRIFNGYCIDSEKKKKTDMVIFQCNKSCVYITFLMSSTHFCQQHILKAIRMLLADTGTV